LRVAEHNKIAINCWVSDLFAQVPWPTQYDLIFFHPPYVPTEVGQSVKVKAPSVDLEARIARP